MARPLGSLCPAHPLAPHMPGHNCPHLPPSYRAAVLRCHPPTPPSPVIHCLPLPRPKYLLLLACLVCHISTAGRNRTSLALKYLSPPLPSASPHLWSGRLRQRGRPTRTSDGDQGHLLPCARIPAPRRRLSRGKIAALASLTFLNLKS